MEKNNNFGNPPKVELMCFRLTSAVRGVTRIMEKYRHKLLRRGDWGRSSGSMGRSLWKPTGYTTERVTFLSILEVLITT
jgi:hypothetical protein